MTDVTIYQVRTDTAANFASANPILLKGEMGRESDTGKFKFGDGSTRWKNLYYADYYFDAAEIVKGTYTGVNLATKHAAEIGSTDIWDWLHARANANNFKGINVGDYVEIACSAATIAGNSVPAKTRRAVLMHIQPYKNTGDTAFTGNYLWCAGATDETITWNDTNNNNGSAYSPHPYLASKLHAVLNGINNASTNPGGAVGYDASSGGYLQTLPANLRSHIVEQRIHMEQRYSTTGLLLNDNNQAWVGRGQLFTPSEIEFYGFSNHSARTDSTSAWNRQGFGPYCQWDGFKSAGATGRLRFGRVGVWASSPASGSSTHAAYLNGSGIASAANTTDADIRALICFQTD